MDTRKALRRFDRVETARLQVIEGGKKNVPSANSATAMNQYIKAAVVNLTFNSILEIASMSVIARYAGTSERKALAVVRDAYHDVRAERDFLRAELSRLKPSGPAGTLRAA